jgi:prepilin-type N-terminal cleavage/methylation domain-containing protein
MRAFTLLELMAGLVIVATLVTLSVSGIRYGLAQARYSGCLSNLRTIGVGVENYVADHDGDLPDLAMGRSSKDADVPVLETVLLDYVGGDTQTFCCPADFKGLWHATGSSYFWNYLPTVMANGRRNHREVSMYFAPLQTDDPARIPLVVTKEAFHFGGTRGTVLYADGRAR